MTSVVEPYPISPVAPSVAGHERVRPGRALGRAVVECDTVVVGTGAGGAVAGTERTRTGDRVVFLEAGGAFAAEHFKRRSFLWSTTNLYAGRGIQLSLGDPPILIPSGRVVGGSTVLNSGICFRPPDERLKEWQSRTGYAWLAPDAMRPFVDEIWARIGVQPTHLGIGRRHNDLLRIGLSRVASDHGWIERNAPGCVGCGVCHLGCPSGGKASVDKAILPEAVARGADIFTYARAFEIVREGGRAKGVRAALLDEQTREPVGELLVRADRVLVAGSALSTPALLLSSGITGGAIGAHLSLHPAGAVLGEFDEPVMMWDGVPQGYYGKDPVDERVMIESANVGIPELHGLLGGVGADGAKRLARYRHYAMAGGMVRDDGGGTVAPGDDTSSIRYSVTARDLAALKAGLRTTTRAYFAAGARAVCPLLHPATFFTEEGAALAAIDRVTAASHFAHVHASHPHGSCRLGPASGEHAGAVGEDGSVHGVPGLYVVDGSLMPTTLGVNPQVTIMALALAIARRMS